MGIRRRRDGMMTRAARRRLAPAGVFALLLSVLPVLSCGGNGGASAVTPPGACLDFTPAADPAPATVVATEGNLTTCDRLALELVVTDVNDVFTADFRLSFDPTVLSYDGYSDDDSVLASDGATVTVIADEDNGLLRFTITRLGASEDGIDVVGSQLLVRLDFLRETDSGASSLTFSNERLWNSEFPLQLIDGVSWSGGSATVR